MLLTSTVGCTGVYTYTASMHSSSVTQVLSIRNSTYTVCVDGCVGGCAGGCVGGWVGVRVGVWVYIHSPSVTQALSICNSSWSEDRREVC